MVAFWIGLFFFIQLITLGFVLVMCKSAAMADKAYECARARETGFWSQNSISIETKPVTNDEELYISPHIVR